MIASVAQQLQAFNQQGNSGAQFGAVKPETVNVTDSVYTISSIGTAPTAVLTIKSENLNTGLFTTGEPITIYKTSTGAVVFTGNTPVSFNALTNVPYTVYAGASSGTTFQYWTDTQSSGPYRQVVLSGAAAFNAGYSGGGPPPPQGQGVIIPLYAYPDTSNQTGIWNTIASLKAQYPLIPVVVIINDNNGRPVAVDQGPFASGLTALNNAGCICLAYVDCGVQGNFQSIAQVEANMNLYLQYWPNPALAGFFFDDAEANSANDTPSYFSSLNTYAKSVISNALTIANPGASLNGIDSPTFPGSAYIGTMDCWCIFENDNAKLALTVSNLQANELSGQPASTWAFIQYGMTSYPGNSLYTSCMALARLGSVAPYGTGGGSSSPYTTQPAAYLSQMLNALSGGSSNSYTITVGTQNGTGGTITSYQIVVATDANMNNIVSQGSSPFTSIPLNPGTYYVLANSFGSENFSKWASDNSTQNPRQVVITNANVILTAVYSP